MSSSSWAPNDVGKKCKTTTGKRGTVKWVGEGKFAPGTWVGVELSTPDGKHDGEVKGTRYFKCKKGHGVMLKPSQVKRLAVKKTAKAGAGTKATAKAAGKASTKTTKASSKTPRKAPPTTAPKKESAKKKKPDGARAARPGASARTQKAAAKGPGKSPNKGASALAAKRKALAAAKARGGKGKKAPTPSKKTAAPKPEPDANELLRLKIMAKLRGDTADNDTDLPPAGDAEADDAEPLPETAESNNLKDKIAARLAAIHNGNETPPTSPTHSTGTATPKTLTASSPAPTISRSPDHVVASKRCTTRDEVATLIQALCRGYLIRVEQFNLLDASVKLLMVEDNQWVVVGQGVAEVTDEVLPYVQVIGWKLDQRAWESTKTLLYETPIRCEDTLTREDDGLGPPIYILNDEYDDIVRGLEFALPQDEEAFEEMYAFARRDTAALNIQAMFRGARVRWSMGAKSSAKPGDKKAPNPALPTPTATPDHHPPIGALIKVKKPMKKSKIGRLISYQTFTGKYQIQYADKTREIDLDKVKYSRVNDTTD